MNVSVLNFKKERPKRSKFRRRYGIRQMITKRAPSRCFLANPESILDLTDLRYVPPSAGLSARRRARRAHARRVFATAAYTVALCTCLRVFAAQTREVRVCARRGSVLGPAQRALEASRAVRGGRCARAHDGLIACAEQCSQLSGRPRSSSSRSTGRSSSAGANLPRLLTLQRAAARRARTALACSVIVAR